MHRQASQIRPGPGGLSCPPPNNGLAPDRSACPHRNYLFGRGRTGAGRNLPIVNDLDTTVGIVALAAAGVALLALLLCVVLMVRVRRLRADQKLVLGDGKADLVAHAAGLARVVDEMHATLAAETDRTAARLAHAEGRLDATVSKTAVLRYDAFNETSGRQSSTLALLDDLDNGVVISAILQRDQARVYAKPIVGGRSSLDLSPEELAAMEQARRGPNPTGQVG